MLTPFFEALRAAKIPVSLREWLTLLEALDRRAIPFDVESFYHLARATLVKDERLIDRFDVVFGRVFNGLEALTDPAAARDLPREWLMKLAEEHLSPEEKAKLEALGFDEIMKRLRERLEEQQGRHQGGSKWIGTAGTSPFGAYGYNPAGVRIGQQGNRSFRAIKVWDKREFKDLDDRVELGTRAMKIALRRLRRFARTGAAEEFDLGSTIDATARAGHLDVKFRPERRNAVKVLLFLDVGGSMDWHVEQAEALFSAARSEFKHFDHFYFHNCPYERLWRANRRRHDETIPTLDVIRTFPTDYRAVFVGDAAMSPTEIALPGGSVEHWNEEPGDTWMRRLTDRFPRSVWLNPVPEAQWGYTQSTVMMRALVHNRMFPMTLDGIERAARELAR